MIDGAGLTDLSEAACEWSSPVAVSRFKEQRMKHDHPNIVLAESEKDFQSDVVALAHTYGWLVSHARPARVMVRGKETYRTAIQGDVGAPDLTLAKNGRVILAELKSEKGKLSAMQTEWLKNCGAIGRLWRPSDWDEILEELSE